MRIILLGARLSYFAASFVGFMAGYFLYSFPTPDKSKKIVWFFAGLMLFIAYISLFTDLVLTNLKIIDNEQINVFGPLYFLYNIYFVSIMTWGVVSLVIKRKILSPQQRLQANFILFGISVSVVFGVLTNLFIPYLIQTTQTEQFGPLSGIFFIVITTYAIVRHRLMDIRFVFRRGSVSTMSLLTIILLIMFIKYSFFKLTAISVEWIDYVFLICGIIVYPYINKYYYRIANQYFFTSLYDAREVIASLSDKLSSTLLVGDIYRYISEEIISALHVKAMGIFIFDQSQLIYELKYYKGNERDKIKSFIEDKGFYTHYLKTNDPVEVDEIKRTVYVKYRKTVDMLAANNVKVLIPLRLKNKTIGMIALGEKESKDNYNDQDIAMLEIIGTQSAIAVNNALSYEEIKNFSKKLEHEVDVATEGLIRANSKLRQLDQAKSEFVSIASHQLRTPLTVIKGYISMMLEGSYGELSGIQKESLEKVFQSNERLIHLVENLLNISRIESGRLRINKEKTRLELMVADVTEELMIRAKGKGLKLIYKKPKNKLPSVNIDRERVRQIILNLIDNAVKYTKKGRVEVSVEQKGNYLQCSVKDTGMGIIKVDYLDLFDKFSRGTGTALVHTEGTGLGLYVAKQMVNLHKGKIWAKSKGKGKGSEFYFTLPVGNKTSKKNKINKSS